jgi:hypothetical protein
MNGTRIASWRASTIVLAPLELLAVVWAVPLAILLVGVPIALVLTLLLWIGRLL